MRQDFFYRCLRDQTGYVAVKTCGYSEGDIGVRQESKLWSATHIPTGIRITPTTSENKNRKEALLEAKQLMDTPDFSERVAKHMDTDAYERFRKSRYDQAATEVF